MPDPNSICGNHPVYGGPVAQSTPMDAAAGTMSRDMRVAAAAAAGGGKVWRGTTKLRVGFFNNSLDSWANKIIEKVKQHAPEWSASCFIDFDFNGFGSSDILINVMPRLGVGFGVYQSQLGTDSRNPASSGQPSMDLVFDRNNDKLDEVEFRRVILHEFGHAIGLIHEHTRPDRPITFTARATQIYSSLTGWRPDQINQQIFTPFRGALDFESPFDRDSIMIYPIPPGAAVDDTGAEFSVGWNRDLSDLDKSTANLMYPGRTVDVPTTRETIELTLNANRTGDKVPGGKSQRYRFTLSSPSLITIKTDHSTGVLKGSLIGPDGTRTLSNDFDFTNLRYFAFLPSGSWTAEIAAINPSISSVTFNLSVTAG